MSNINQVEAVYRRDYIQEIITKNEAIGRAYWRRENVLLVPLMLVYLIVGCLFVVMADALLSPMLPDLQLHMRLALSVLFGGLLAYVINSVWFDPVCNMVVRQGLAGTDGIGDIRVRIDNAGVQWTATDSEMFLAWSGVEKIELRDRALVFLSTPDTYFIPRDAFGTDADLMIVLERDIFPRLLTKARDLTEQDAGVRKLMRKLLPKAVKSKAQKRKNAKSEKIAADGLDAAGVDPSVLEQTMTEVAPLDDSFSECIAPDAASEVIDGDATLGPEPDFDLEPGVVASRGRTPTKFSRKVTAAISPDAPVERRGFFGRAKSVTPVKNAPSDAPPSFDQSAESLSAVVPVETFAALEVASTATPTDTMPIETTWGATDGAAVEEAASDAFDTPAAQPVFGKLGSPRPPNLRNPLRSPRQANVVTRPDPDRPTPSGSDFAGFVDDTAQPAATAAAEWPEMSPLLDPPPFMAQSRGGNSDIVHVGMSKTDREPTSSALSFDRFDTLRSPQETAHRGPTPAPAPAPSPSKSSSMFWPAPVSAWPSLSNARRQTEAADPARRPDEGRPAHDDARLFGVAPVTSVDHVPDADASDVAERAEDGAQQADLDGFGPQEADVHVATGQDPSYWRLGKRKVRGRVRRSDSASIAADWPVR